MSVSEGLRGAGGAVPKVDAAVERHMGQCLAARYPRFVQLVGVF